MSPQMHVVHWPQVRYVNMFPKLIIESLHGISLMKVHTLCPGCRDMHVLYLGIHFAILGVLSNGTGFIGILIHRIYP